MSHRHAAILAADVAHYSRLMEGDGEGTVQALKDCRKIFQRCVTEHHGHEFGSVGDSLMAEFSSPVEALRAAQCVQQELAETGNNVDNSMKMRIGLHSGDVISDGVDVFGDVVNMAARLQMLAEPGGIVLSGLMHEQVRKEPGFEFRVLGRQHLKNMDEPILAFELTDDQSAVNWRRLRLAAGEYRIAIATIIGVVISGFFFVGYFETTGAGISTVIEVPDQPLVETPARVAAHGEYMLGRRELHRRTPESVSQSLEHFENAARLDPDYPLAWAGIADALGTLPYLTTVTQADVFERRVAAIEKALALDPDSGEAYAALAYMNLNHGDLKSAEMSVISAIDLNPGSADAHYVYSRIFYQSGRLEEAVRYIREAIRLAPDVPHFVHLLGDYLWAQGRVEEAHVVLVEGARANPEYVGFYKSMAEQLTRLSRLGEAMLWIDWALRLSPTDEQLQWQRCYTFLTINDLETAERCIETSAQLTEMSRLRLNISLNRARLDWEANAALISPYLDREDLTMGQKRLFASYFFIHGYKEKALEFWQELEPGYCGEEPVEIEPWKLLTAYWVARTLMATGREDRANYLFDQMLHRMESMHRLRGIGYGIWDVLVHEARGEHDLAIAAARQARQQGHIDIAWWNLRMPGEIRDDPAWQALLEDSLAEVARQRVWYEEHRNDPLF